MKHVSPVEMLQRVRNSVTVNESFEKNRTTGREVFGTEILFLGKDLREGPREKHEEQVGVKEEELDGVSCREVGREQWEVWLGHRNTRSFLLSSKFCLIIIRHWSMYDLLRQVCHGTKTSLATLRKYCILHIPQDLVL